MTYIDLMLAWDMMAGLDGLKLKANQSFVQSQAIWLNWCGASVGKLNMFAEQLPTF